MAPGVCVTSLRMILCSELTRFRLTPIATLPLNNAYVNSWKHRGRRYCSQLSTTNEDSINSGEVTVKYIHGLPHITVPLPSRNEKCRFALKPVTHKVGDLVDMLKLEDRGIDRATILNNDGVRIASTCSIESLMDEPFWLQINDQQYKVVPPSRERISADDLSKLGDIRSLVAQLYEALHVGEYHVKMEKELLSKLEDLKYKISPLEDQKSELSIQAGRKANFMTWFGLGLMSVQFGILARLTWWEYSWDIMEPVTYFVTYGTAMAAYAYFCITKQEYNYPEVKDRQYLLTIHKRAKKKGFDIDYYNSLKRQIADLEFDLRRLRDPLNLQLPPHLERSFQGPSSIQSRDDWSSSTSSPSSSSASGADTTNKLSLTKTILQSAARKFIKH